MGVALCIHGYIIVTCFHTVMIFLNYFLFKCIVSLFFIFNVMRVIHEPLARMIEATPSHVSTLINRLIDWIDWLIHAKKITISSGHLGLWLMCTYTFYLTFWSGYNIWVCRWNLWLLPFKFIPFISIFTWYYFFFSILQFNGIWNCRWILFWPLLAVRGFGPTKVNKNYMTLTC